MRTHYDTLGVPQDASLENIKAKFRELSKETHPDVGGRTACAERFKEISAAANILTNEKRRRVYDSQLRRNIVYPGHVPHGGFGNVGRTSRPGPGVATTPSQIFISNIMRPRSFAIGTFAILVGAYALSFFGEKDTTGLHRDGSQLIKAWKNPKTGQYEQPTPWDPEYRRLNPILEEVPRHLVQKRNR
jgi:curved DNA-binding protein CbpA